jgi:hypothetical protein
MPSVNITKPAIDAILRQCNDPAAINLKAKKPIPLLLWSIRSYFDDNSGHRTEFGPQFYFYWTDIEEIKQYGYFKVDLTDDRELALAPGELFESGAHRIVLEGDKLTLDDSA